MTPEGALHRAIHLAMLGRGAVEPNPMVGCVLLRQDVVIGEGYHARVGGAHAEPTALADCRARGNSPAGAMAVVTLEPCCHTGKRTPPCVPALLSAGVAKVLVGTLDPNPQVNGQGIGQLRAAGVEVDVASGELGLRCRQLLASFIARTVLGRPYITLKWAESADGFIAGAGGARRQITSGVANEVVHKLRARCDAIVIGGQTLRTDDPVLTVRLADPPPFARTPLRAVISRRGEIPPGARLRTVPGEGEVLVYRDVEEALGDLHARGCAHVLVESGSGGAGGLAQELIRRNVVDRAWAFRSPVRLGEAGVPALSLDWPVAARARVGVDELTEMFNPASTVFALAEPSADFLQLVQPADRKGP